MNSVLNIQHSCCGEEMTIRNAMGRINQMPTAQQFQIVLDAANRVVGTVTDGDIRRALLRGVNLDEPVTACMHRNSAVGAVGQNEMNYRTLASLSSNVRFLPVVDGEGRLVSILTPAEHIESKVHALVMAGGFGRRMGERTINVPKPLLKIGEQPILGHILDRLEECGISSITVSVHYLADQIVRFVEGHGKDAKIDIIHEQMPIGTAGAIRLLPRRDFDSLMVLNADILTSLKLDAFVRFHNEQKNDATIAAATHEVQIPYGVIEHTESGLFRGIAEKPVLRHFVSAGINLLSRDICRLVPEDGALDMPDLLRRGHTAGMRIGVFPIHEYWTDVGRPEDFDRADAIYRKPQEGAN